MLANIERLQITGKSPERQKRIAQQVLELLSRDYGRIDPNIDTRQLLGMFDSGDDQLVNQQRNRLRAPAPGVDYWSIETEGFTGFAKTGEWRRGDQAPFERWPQLARSMGKIGLMHYQATGLFAFAIDPVVTRDESSRQEATMAALMAVRSTIPQENELRAAVDLEDTFLNSAFDQLGALPSTSTGSISLGEYKRDYGLRILPPQAPSE